MPRDWGDERPALTKRYVDAIDRQMDAALEGSGRQTAGHLVKALGLMAMTPVAMGGAAVGIDDLGSLGPHFIGQAVDNGLAVGAMSGWLTAVGIGVGTVMSDLIRETDDAGLHRRLTTTVTRLRTASTVVGSASALAAVGLDVTNAVHAIATPTLVAVADNTTAGAAGVLLTTIAATKLIKAISPRAWGSLAE